jgi:hypothetical protein
MFAPIRHTRRAVPVASRFVIKEPAPRGGRFDHDEAVIWMTCHRQRLAHAVPADVHSPAYHAFGLVDAVCGRVVYLLRVAEKGARRCKQCTQKLPPDPSDNAW